MEVRGLRCQRSRWTGPRVEGGRGEDRFCVKTIFSWVQAPQFRLELRVKMKGFEIQVIGAWAKRQLVTSLLLVGLEVRRGKAGVREKTVKSDMLRWVGLEMWLLLLLLIITAALGSQREINHWGTCGQETCFLPLALSAHGEKLSKCWVNESLEDCMEGDWALLVLQAVKRQLLEQAQRQLLELLDQAVSEAVQSYPPQGRRLPTIPPDSLSK